jgi:transketolase
MKKQFLNLAKTKCIVTAEEHNTWRSWRKHFKSIGIKQPSSQEFVAVNDSFGESGTLPINGKYKLNNQDC